jgi:hypothetical protein
MADAYHTLLIVTRELGVPALIDPDNATYVLQTRQGVDVPLLRAPFSFRPQDMLMESIECSSRSNRTEFANFAAQIKG